jgi:hypothetical protein
MVTLQRRISNDALAATCLSTVAVGTIVTWNSSGVIVPATENSATVQVVVAKKSPTECFIQGSGAHVKTTLFVSQAIGTRLILGPSGIPIPATGSYDGIFWPVGTVVPNGFIFEPETLPVLLRD